MSGPSSETRDEHLWSGHTGRILGVLSLGWFAVRFGREALPPLLPTIISDLAITSSQAGFALTFMLLWYSTLQFPGGRISDQLTKKSVLLASIVFLLVGFGLVTQTTNYASLLLALSFVGIGSGLFFVPGRSLLSDLFVQKRGSAFGVQSAAGSIGALVAAGVAAVIVTVAPWQTAFFPVLFVFLIVFVSVYVLGDESITVESVDLAIRATATRVLANDSIRWLLLAYMLVSFSWQAFLGFLPLYLQTVHEFSPTAASLSYGLIFVVAFFVGPAVGLLGDRYTRTVVASVSLSIAGTGLLTLLVFSSYGGTPLAVITSVVIIAGGLRGFPPVMQSHLMSLFPEATRGGDFGGAKTIWSSCGSFGPLYLGIMADTLGLATGFAGLIVLLMTSSLIIWRVRSR